MSSTQRDTTLVAWPGEPGILSPHQVASASVKRSGPIRRRAGILQFGYKYRNEAAHRTWNLSLGLALAFFCLPLLLATALIVYLDSGGPVIYRGARLGRNRKTFFLYKFRTLKPEAAIVTKGCVLPVGSGLETRVGKILRDTRLDEIPQLLNVIRGDMNLFGPRPVRQEIADSCAKRIAYYDKRFLVKPGILGHAQVFMPHGASKRIRARYNNILVSRHSNPFKELVFIGFVGGTAMLKLAQAARRRALRNRAKSRPSSQRLLPGDREKVAVVLKDTQGHCLPAAQFNEMRDDMLSICLEAVVPDQPCFIAMRRVMSTGKVRHVICTVQLQRLESESVSRPLTVPEVPPRFLYEARCVPVSDFQKYVIDTYFARSRFAGFE
jgi:lipopolysaccharide/colanic/teichoic acid biosynthesis glycosyltransferase